MLQNRVDPCGNIIKTNARGYWMGNRGILHDDEQNIIRPFKLKAWLICKLEFNGRKRQVMSPHRYTELFFLDEATAFAAGHRPCFECRRQDFNRFRFFFLKGNVAFGFTEKTSISEIDALMHHQRIDSRRAKITFEESAENIPEGTFILFDEKPYIFLKNRIFAWSPFGYEKSEAMPKVKKFTVLTPLSIVNTLRAGYKTQIAIKLNSY
ncbi:MAG TPA: hypothetical protein VIH86_04140 [Puia sp.]|jgi:hypothetical protein